MRIAFDAIALLGAMSKNRGIGNYTFDLFTTILKNDLENEYFWFNVLEKTDYFTKDIEEGRLHAEDLICVQDGSFFQLRDMQEIYGELIKAFIKKNNIDVFVITSPFDSHYMTYQREWFEGVRVTAIVYDIIPYVMQDHYFPRKEGMAWYMERVDQLRWADQLLVISQSVKDDLIEYLNFPDEKIQVIWGACGEKFKQVKLTQQQVNDLYKKFSINSPFVMCTGGDDERKNISELITAFSKLPKELIKQYQLVIVCKLQKASVERYTKLAEKNGIAGRVVLTNFVTDQELVALYNLATLVAFPSVYEGFGLPVVEAWACGTPVLTSNNSSLGQIGDGAAELVNPHSIEDICKGLERALLPERLAELKELGQQRLKMFRWEKVAKDTVDYIKQLDVSKNIREEEKKRIAFFTPLPPKKSGISDYSVDVIHAISKYFDIDVYIDDGYQAECDLPKNVNVKTHTEYEIKRSKYYDTIFQVGNSEYHIYMGEYIRKYGGTVVLHDYNMHGVAQYKALALDGNDIAQYRKMLKEDYGEAVVDRYIKGIQNGGPIKIHEMELNGFLTDYADKIIVHSQDAKEKLLRRDIGRNVFLIPSYVKIEPLADTRAVKKKLNIPEDQFVFAAFGHIHETKRVIPIVNAFARLAKQDENVRLIFVGKLDSSIEEAFHENVERLGIADKVKITGYTEIEEFRQYIDATDVCINLRWPYNGETSGSLMRILGKGKCVVVNNIGSFGEIPDEACIKLPSVGDMHERKEVNLIYQAMETLRNDESIRTRLEHHARAYAEEHLDLNIIAKQYRDAVLTPKKCIVSEELLYRIKEDMNQHQELNKAADAISKVLAYIK